MRHEVTTYFRGCSGADGSDVTENAEEHVAARINK